jgi:hypothetical protein
LGNLKAAGKKLLNETTGQTKSETGDKVSNSLSVENPDIQQDVQVGIPGDEDKGNYNIVFSSSPVNPDHPADLKSEFSSGDKIYAMAILPKTVQELFPNARPNDKLQVEIFIYTVKPPLYSYQKEPREEQLVFVNMYISGDLKKNKYLLIDLVPDPETTRSYGHPDITFREFGKKWDGPANFAEALAGLEPGDNQLKVVVNCYYEPVAKGMFTLTGDNFEYYAGMAEQLNQSAASAGARSARLPAAEKSDPALEKQMLAALKGSNDWASGRFDATETIKIHIYDKDWYIRRHELTGAILHRYIRAAVAVKTKSGQCAYYIVTYQEDYIGGAFQPLKYDGATDKVILECGNLN